MEQSKKNNKSGDKYYANLSCSSNGLAYTNLRFQIDSAATCNTVSHDIIQKHFPDTKLQESRYLLHPYGDSRPIKPIEQITLLCEKYKKYHTVVFQVVPSNIMNGKPALLSGKECVNMRIIKINSDNVYSLQQQKKRQSDYHGHINKPTNAKRYREEADKLDQITYQGGTN